jgi:hypothetical protein
MSKPIFDDTTSAFVSPQPAPGHEQDLVVGGGRVAVVDQDGVGHTIPVENLDKAVAAGWRPEGFAEHHERQMEQEYADHPVQAFVQGAAGTITGGLSDAFLETMDPEGTQERLARNRGAALAGNVAGAFVPWGAGGLATKAGEAAGAALKGAGFIGELAEGGLLARAAARALPRIAEAAGAGAAFGAGQGLSNIALAQHPLTVEAIASELGGSILTGAGYGAAAGGLLSAIGEVAGGVKTVAQRMAARASVDAEAAAAKATEGAGQALDAAEGARIAKLDATSAKTEIEAEKGALGEARAAEAKTLADDVRAFRQDVVRPLGIQLVEELPKGQGLARELIKGERGIENVVGNMKGLAADPGKALNSLQRYEQALQEVADRVADHPELAPRAQAALDQVAKLQERVQAATAPVQSPRLAALMDRVEQIKAAPDVAGAARPLIRSGMALAAHTVFGPLGAAAMHLAGDKLVNLVAGLGSKLGDIASTLPAKIEKGADLALRATQASGTTRAAATVLSSVRFADMNAPTKYKQSAADVFKQRSAELAQAVAQPEQTKAGFMQKLQGIAAAVPGLATKVADVLYNRLQYLYQQMPKAQPVGMITDDRWQPSTTDLAKFARVVDAVQNPTRILDDLKANKLTPEVVQAVKATSPATFEAVQQALMSRLADMKNVPYEKRVFLSVLFEKPLDTTMRPDFVAAMQANFAAPSPPPQNQPARPRMSALGQTAKPEPTPAQKLGG